MKDSPKVDRTVFADFTSPLSQNQNTSDKPKEVDQLSCQVEIDPPVRYEVASPRKAIVRVK
jgi:hypothetical protein